MSAEPLDDPGAPRPYKDVALGLLAAGYSPLPLPARRKFPPPDGYTGADGDMAQGPDVYEWCADPKHGAGNTAARLPEEAVGLDLDAYGGKPGAVTWAGLVVEHGPPPATWVVFNRDDDSGIRLFRLPEGITEDQLGSGLPGIDVIRHGHRYATAPGSIHPEGRVYQCRHEATHEILDNLPKVADLPVLPLAWAQAFSKAQKAADEAAEKARALTPGRPCQAVLTALSNAQDALDSGGSRHDAAQATVARLVRFGDQGHAGVERALGDLRAEFVEAVAQPRDSSTVGARSTPQAVREFNDMVRSGLGLIAASPTPDVDRGCCTRLGRNERDQREWIADANRGHSEQGQSQQEGDRAGEEPGGEDRRHPPGSPGRRVALTPASAIAPLRAKWLWEGRLAFGTLAILAGREGVGKSTLAYWLAAQITLGTLPGELLGRPAAVLVAATEDSWAHTIIPRLIAAGADLDRVFRVDVSTDLGGAELILPTDVRAVGDAAGETGAALLLLDPLMSRLSSSLDTHKDQETRQALEPLTKMLDATRLVAVGLMHFNKSGSDDPLNALMASRAFSAVARSVSTVVRDPDDDDGQRRLFGTPKNNLGPDNLPLLSFTLASFPVPTEEGDAWTSRIVWGEQVVATITDVLRRTNDSGDRTATQEAADWLDDYLTQQGGQADSAAVKKAGAAAGHSADSLHRARKRLGLATSSAGFPRRTMWELPQSSAPSRGTRGETHTTATTATTGHSHRSHRSRGTRGDPATTDATTASGTQTGRGEDAVTDPPSEPPDDDLDADLQQSLDDLCGEPS